MTESDSYRLILSNRAAANIQSIHDYIAGDSARNASRMVERILHGIDGLKLFPHRAVFEISDSRLKHPVRTLTVRPFVIFFRVMDDERIVRVLHIRHGARRRPRRMD